LTPKQSYHSALRRQFLGQGQWLRSKHLDVSRWTSITELNRQIRTIDHSSIEDNIYGRGWNMLEVNICKIVSFVQVRQSGSAHLQRRDRPDAPSSSSRDLAMATNGPGSIFGHASWATECLIYLKDQTALATVTAYSGDDRGIPLSVNWSMLSSMCSYWPCLLNHCNPCTDYGNAPVKPSVSVVLWPMIGPCRRRLPWPIPMRNSTHPSGSHPSWRGCACPGANQL
jgi:hypothetical protein